MHRAAVGRAVKPCRILFVTWDGPQVSYLESLYTPIFQRLAEQGYAVHVLQFTWAGAAQRSKIKAVCESGGATYRSAPVLRRPRAVGGLLTAVAGVWRVRREIFRRGIDVVIPRSTLPALSTVLALRGVPSVRMLFDADGLPHDERIDFAGASPNSPSYRILREIEATAVRKADVVLTRSSKAAEILQARAGAGTAADKFFVAGNGRDPSRFDPGSAATRSAVRRELGVHDSAPLLVYAGSIGAQYCIPEMVAVFAQVRARRPDARFLLLTGSPEEATRELAAHGVDLEVCMVRRVAADAVPRCLAAADMGLALRRPGFSMLAVAPIKLGEYLLCGLPVLATRAIGDTERWVPQSAGLLLGDMSPEALDAAAGWFVDSVLPARDAYRQQARVAGLLNFDLAGTVDTYVRALQKSLAAQR